MWQHYVLVFLSSAGIMTVELVAGRLIAPSLGVASNALGSIAVSPDHS